MNQGNNELTRKPKTKPSTQSSKNKNKVCKCTCSLSSTELARSLYSVDILYDAFYHILNSTTWGEQDMQSGTLVSHAYRLFSPTAIFSSQLNRTTCRRTQSRNSTILSDFGRIMSPLPKKKKKTNLSLNPRWVYLFFFEWKE